MIEPSPTVYSYYTPEISNTVAKALIGLNHTGPGGNTTPEGIHAVLKKNFDPGLDDLHLPLMEKYEAFARQEGVIGLDTFSNKYFTNGSSEGIFHLLSDAKARGEKVYVFDGEYQGYQAYADALDLDLETISWQDANKVPTGTVIFSNPASKNGNIVPSSILNHILQYHSVILDLAYMGMTQKPLNIDLTNPHIVAVVGSLSKPFGMYYYRIGFCYSKSPVASLYGNKWFKNALSIKLGEAVLNEAQGSKFKTFKDKYFELQAKAVDEIHRDFVYSGSVAKVEPSDVWLLAYADLGLDLNTNQAPFKRGEQGYRFCLTPYYMRGFDGQGH